MSKLRVIIEYILAYFLVRYMDESTLPSRIKELIARILHKYQSLSSSTVTEVTDADFLIKLASEPEHYAAALEGRIPLSNFELIGSPTTTSSSSKPVSSQGCSRAFILKGKTKY
jgi:hypothetical protein